MEHPKRFVAYLIGIALGFDCCWYGLTHKPNNDLLYSALLCFILTILVWLTFFKE